MPSAAQIRDALNDVLDPEMPIGIGDLGMIDDVAVEFGHARVTLLPTFAGCPAVEMIRSSVEARVRSLGIDDVEVRWSLARPWTPERVNGAGVAALRRHGLSPGARGGAQTCPFCGSADVERVSGFGGSLCRATYRCGSCRDTFESLKPSGIAYEPAAGTISLL